MRIAFIRVSFGLGWWAPTPSTHGSGVQRERKHNPRNPLPPRATIGTATQAALNTKLLAVSTNAATMPTRGTKMSAFFSGHIV